VADIREAEELQDAFVKRFVANWMDECWQRGVTYMDRPDSNIRLLARTIARSLFPEGER
jgi:hypothetical protein